MLYGFYLSCPSMMHIEETLMMIMMTVMILIITLLFIYLIIKWCRRPRSENALTLHSKGPEASAETNLLPSENMCSSQPAQQPNSIIRLLPSANDVSGNTSSVGSSSPVSADRVIIVPHNPTHQPVIHAETLPVNRISVGTTTRRTYSYSSSNSRPMFLRRRRTIRLGASSSSVVRDSESITSQAEQNLSRSRRLQKPPSIPDLCVVNPESRPLLDNVIYRSHRTNVIGAEAAPCGPVSSSSFVRASESITSQAVPNLSLSATSEKLPASDKMVHVNGRLPKPPSIPDLCGVNPESRPLPDNVEYSSHRTIVIGAEAAPCGPESSSSFVRASESITLQTVPNVSRSRSLPKPPSVPDLCGVNPESRPLPDNVEYISHRTVVIGAEAAPCRPVSTAPPQRVRKARRSRLNEHYVRDSEPSKKKFDLRGLYLDPAMALFYAFYHQMKKMYTHEGYKEEDRYIYVVTGYGKFSKNGIPKIKPAVQSFLDKNKIRQRWLNPGLVMIDFCEEVDEEKDLDDDTDSDD
ncbi:trichohyalin [Biomphalaria pfeifferi]|uniref:Trichohyalin n=1 Tax=Biomphalaria pfeifferi TaxID=112525 RepID=A0AAD8C3F5_BIOPF|nr:trichohyalin [Biomphalaria pfeifferi]